MKILIIRMYPDVLNYKSYNCQEIGLAKALIRKGNICDIVLYTDKKEYEEDIKFDDGTKNIHIYHLNAKNFFKNAIYGKRIYKIIENYDVIQSTEYDQIGNVKLFEKVKKLNKKMLIYHGPYESKYTKGYKLKCLMSDIYYIFKKNYKNITCMAKSELAAKFLEKKGFKDVNVIGVGLDNEKFKNIAENNDEIIQLVDRKNKEKLKYLLYIGKIEERRNIFFMMDVLKNVVSVEKNIRLIIVGNGELQYVKKCFDYAKENEIIQYIIYFDKLKQEELPNIYLNSDIFLLPTQYEIFGMVLLEAMYFFKPVITTLNGGSSMLIDDKKNGFIINTEDEIKWKDTILFLLKNNTEYNSISQLANKIVKERFLWEKIAETILKIYNKNNK